MSCTTTRFARRRRRRCTMICATILLCYLATCCTHLTLLTIATDPAGVEQQQQQLAANLSSSSAAPHLHQPTASGSAPQAASSSGSGSGAGASATHQAPQIALKDLKHDNVHKLMSEQDLRRTFQVDSHDQVPEYEILKLTVNDDGSHLISPISDLGELTTSSSATTSTTTEEKLIVMKLSTFGKDFKLRLKRNVDFQQRIKDMKMFMAESTQDGQLRYTEIKSGPSAATAVSAASSHHHHQHSKQEPHKRAAGSGDGDDDVAEEPQLSIEPSAAAKEEAPKKSDHQKQQQKKTTTTATKPKQATMAASGGGGGASGSSSAAAAAAAAAQANVWNIGSTYHDEDNLAALLIDRNRHTGQLQVDGTIGNDFVIKPMPQATIDALLMKQRQHDEQQQRQRQQQQQEQAEQLAAADNSQLARAAHYNATVANNNNNANVDLERAAATTTGGTAGKVAASVTTSPAAKGQQTAAASGDLSVALHMHDDDPHDDDEMFLDEDEALELAHLHPAGARSGEPKQQPATASAHWQPTKQRSGNNSSLLQLPQQQPQQPRALSKAASERKWKKHRKLMAQTQVPKPSALAHDDHQRPMEKQSATAASSSAAAARVRRHAHNNNQAASEPQAVQVAHHIVYRQRPSAEGSEATHQHSFMVAPQEYSPDAMQRLAFSFAPQRINKRAADGSDEDDDDNMIDAASTGERLARADADQDADFLHDPLGGQFYLEPGSVTGFERAGHSDWSLIGARRSSLAPPPYALNGTASAGNGTTSASHARYRRHASGGPAAPVAAAHRSQVRRKRQAPDTVWPEVLLVVDYDSFLLHGGDSRDVKRYFVSFWNGVDLRYKLLVHPHIRISLAGMIVAKDRDATPYLERNRLRAPNADAVDAAGALTDMGKYLYREDRLPTYDLAVVITKLDMCRRRYEGGRCNRGTAGFAYVGGACVVNKRLEKVNSVAIIEDSGGFSGIIVAAHEVGHLLGCVHDGSPPPSYLGGPGATHCPWEDGFIMSDLRHTERGFRWSQCSVEQFKHFLNGETATCLYNYPHESQMLHRLLPGTMLSLDEQCKRDRGTNACFKDARVCAQLFCFDSASGYCVSYRPAAEGSPCGEGQVCRNGKCVGEIENIIPDYTHQSQTVVARRPAQAAGPHSVARLTGSAATNDNGLSASSTSAATSSPDPGSKLPPIVAGAPQITSRMDTFPIDSPIASSSVYPGYGGRFTTSTISDGANMDQTTGSGAGQLAMMRQAASSPNGITATTLASAGHSQARQKSAKLVAPTADYNSGANNNNFKQHGYQQRSGHQAIPRGANGGQSSPVKPAAVAATYHHQFAAANSQPNHQHHQQQQHHHPRTSPSALYTSASTMSHQYPSSSSGNNLLTSLSTSSATSAMKQQLHAQQPQHLQGINHQFGGHNNHNHNNIEDHHHLVQQHVHRNVNPYSNGRPSTSAASISSSGTGSNQLYSSLAPHTSVVVA